MKFSKPFKVVCSVLMSALISNVPAVAFANQNHGMISTSVVVEQLDRAQAEQEIQSQLNRDDVQKALIANGVSPDEVSTRLATLSDSELRQLSGQLHEARAGGDILVAVLLVVLIIFLIKRI